jgi:hypothetical protein
VKRALKLAGALGLVVLSAVAVVRSVWSVRNPPLPPPPTAAELEALEDRREQLRAEILEEIRKGDQGLSKAPKAGILIGVPTRLTASIVTQVVTGLFGKTTLTLRNLKAHVSKEVRAKLLIKKRTIGRIDLGVDIHEIRGLLEPGPPKLAFGGDVVGLELPVRVASGHGRATLHAKWDSKGVANAVCGDVEVHPEVSGRVVPTDYRVAGSFHFRTEGRQVVLTPRFGDLKVRLFVKPDEESWKVVEQVVAERGKVCRMALDKVDLRAQLEKVLGKGFNVKIPSKIFKPVRLPAGVQKSLELQGVRLTLDVQPSALVIEQDRLWYGANVRAARDGRTGPPSKGKPGAAASPPPPPPPPPDGESPDASY